MELHLALKEIVEKEGSGILTETRLVNILADYNAYENSASARHILRIIIENNYINDLILKINDVDSYCLIGNNIIHDINRLYGIDKESARQTLKAISFALHNDAVFFNICAKMETEKTNPSYMTFKDVSFDNDLSSFASELIKKGCNIYLESDNTIDLEGSFALIPGCDFTIYATDITKRVFKVLVVCPRRSTWDEAYVDYVCIREKLQEKYGKPSMVQEVRCSLKKQDLDTFERYGCSFCVKDGEIHLDINGFGKFVQLWIVDKINSDLMQTEHNDSSIADF